MIAPASDALREWVAARDRRPELPLDDDTALFIDRRLTSLDLPELILELETIARRTISIDEVTAEAFGSLRAMRERFL